MSNWIDLIRQIIGVGGGATLAVLVAGFVVRGSIAKAVQHAANREIERMKHDLAAEAEARKQDFARELEHERSAAQRSLELFKSQLSLGSEVRRQVAALKVKALVEFHDEARVFSRDAFNINPQDPAARARAVTQMHECFDRVRKLEAFVSSEVHVQMSDFVSKTYTAADRWSRGVDEGAWDDAREAVRQLVDLVRSELGVNPTVPLTQQ